MIFVTWKNAKCLRYFDLLNVIWDNSSKFIEEILLQCCKFQNNNWILYFYNTRDCIFWKYNLKYRSFVPESSRSIRARFHLPMECYACFSRPYKRPVEPLKAAEVNGWMDLSDEYPPYRGASSSITVRMCPIRRVFLFSPLPMGQIFARFVMDDRRWDSRFRFRNFVFFSHFFLLSMINT